MVFIAKGMYVARVSDGTLGVVAEVPNTVGFYHVSWLTEWNEATQELHHFQEFVAHGDILKLDTDRKHSGLEALKRYILR